MVVKPQLMGPLLCPHDLCVGRAANQAGLSEVKPVQEHCQPDEPRQDHILIHRACWRRTFQFFMFTAHEAKWSAYGRCVSACEVCQCCWQASWPMRSTVLNQSLPVDWFQRPISRRLLQSLTLSCIDRPFKIDAPVQANSNTIVRPRLPCRRRPCRRIRQGCSGLTLNSSALAEIATHPAGLHEYSLQHATSSIFRQPITKAQVNLL